MRSLMSRALKGETFSAVEQFGKTEFGAPQWEIAHEPLRDAKGRVFGAFHHARDLTESAARAAAIVRMDDFRRHLDDAGLRRILDELDDRLRDIEDVDTIAGLCAQVVGQTLKACLSGFGTVLPDAESVQVERDWTANGAGSVVGVPHFGDFGGYIEDLRRGDDVVLNDVETHSPRVKTKRFLAEMGHTPLEASDGAAGLDVLRSNARIDLLISDVGLPGGMNGRQLADAARVLRPELKVLSSPAMRKTRC